MHNQREAAESGLAHGAIGYLNTDWGDNGHWQHLPVSYLGFAYGAALSWSVEANRGLDLPRALDLHAFHDGAGVMGGLVYDLGNAYLQPDAAGSHGSLLAFALIRHSGIDPQLSQLTVDGLERTEAYLDRVMGNLPAARIQALGRDVIVPEGAAMWGHDNQWPNRVGDRDFSSGSITPETCATLAADMERHFSRRAGLDPDRPARREAYHARGAAETDPRCPPGPDRLYATL